MLTPDAFERRARALIGAGLAAFLAVTAALAWWQIAATGLAHEDRNPRLLARFYDPNRGRILDRDGNVVVESLADGRRYLHDASYAHIVGYLDPRYGSQGVELAYDSVLAGQRTGGWLDAIRQELLREKPAGADLRLTIDPAAQRAAAAALGGRRGAVVAIDPRAGDILAMVSVPTFDPGALGSTGEALLSDPAAPLLNRATQGLYPPGSTFKTVTAAAALEAGIVTPETIVECPGEIVIDGFPISCRNTPQGVGTYPFSAAFTYSVNAVFARLGVELGWARLEETARAFGFEAAPPFPLEAAVSRLARPGSERSTVLLASTAFGQGELLATPLQMALVAAAVASGGEVPTPRIALDAWRAGQRVEVLSQPSSRRAIDPGVAVQLQAMMRSVVTAGQASGLAIPGVAVAGKTGTAEAGDGTSHAWFIGFAPLEDPQVAVAVVVEAGGQGGAVAAPIAGAVIEAVVRR
ncbi:penicillin-binding protein 2 [Tepidiforma sp.]|uniref:peptidoglycan D,D-transpeptidase FtsI family protein n=1 Tax=Tepidiforma sp. TaxID=2682230 RepID=UPI002ADD96C0|nr:penicillin-binding protein 2 [Tepidiforma sp.]